MKRKNLEMGLKQNILNALSDNLTYTDNNGNNVLPPVGKNSKLDTLANDLTKAIATFIEDLDFEVLELKSPGMIKPGQINTVGSPAAQSNLVPVPLIVQVSATKNEVGLPTVASEVRTSSVKVKKNAIDGAK
tara:strand:+ start:243 stop:638 length:396 start_codon:yes stop_codon:yes gene_type:complete